MPAFPNEQLGCEQKHMDCKEAKAMAMEDAAFLKDMVRLCGDGWLMGWHERNAGNLSYVLGNDDIRAAEGLFGTSGEHHAWRLLDVEANQLTGRFLVVSGAGRLFRNAADAPAEAFGIVEISESGEHYRVVWGLEGGRPTSEFPTHVIAHEARLAATQGRNRVVYHAHCPSVIALSNILEPSSRTWTRALWRTMTEAVLFFPEGVGAVAWMVPGGRDIALASGELLQRFPACVWTQHGLFATGESCDDAFGLAHMIEKTASIYLQGRAACGGKEPPFHVSDEQLARICRESGVEPNWDYLS